MKYIVFYVIRFVVGANTKLSNYILIKNLQTQLELTIKKYFTSNHIEL